MTAERWSEIERLFHLAARLPASERPAFLRRCSPDAALRREVEGLLEGHDDPVAFLDTPALGSGFELPPIDRGEDPLVGRAIGPFRIEERVAAGGMGTVYRAAREEGFHQTVAVKVVHRWHNPESILKRFRVERQTLAQLNHPNIARLYDAGMTEDGLLYLVMEFIEGQPIDVYCDKRCLDIDERLRLFEVVARTVHFAHQNLVVHRDLKPGNVMVTDDGLPKLLDFGIAKILDAEDSAAPSGRTATMTMVMTPEYASPEQVRGEPITTATDVYSLGVVLYGLLSGRSPHRLTTLHMEEIERVVCRETPRRPSTVLYEDVENAKTPMSVAASRGTTPPRLHRLLRGDLDNITLSCLQKDPHRRYASALQLAEDLQRYREGRPVEARGDSVWYRTLKFVRRNRVAVGAGVAVVLALAGGMAATAWQASIAAEERDAARAAQTKADAEAMAARAAEQDALEQAEHASIEAESAGHLAEFLVDAFLGSSARHTEQDVERAASMLDMQIERVRRQFVDEPHLRANLLDALGGVCVSLGLHDKAGDVIAEAAAIRREEFGADSLEYALSLNSIAELDYAVGRYEPAVEGFRKALELHRGLPTGVHTDVAKTANNLAVALRNLGELDEAEALHVEALALRRQQFGDQHPLVAESLNNLAIVHMSRAAYDEAVDELEEALAIRVGTLGDGHPLTVQSRSNLANALALTGDYDSADALYRAALELSGGAMGMDPEGLGRMLVSHGEVLMKLGRTDEARRALEEGLAVRRAHFGEGSLQVAAALSGLARLESACGDFERALELSREVLDTQRRILPGGHPKIATSLTTYGSMLLDVGDAAAAEEPLREAVHSYRAALPPGHWFTAVAEVNLGDCLLQLDRHEEAEKLLLGAHEVLESARGPDSEEARTARGCLVRLYESWEKPERAAAWRQ